MQPKRFILSGAASALLVLASASYAADMPAEATINPMPEVTASPPADAVATPAPEAASSPPSEATTMHRPTHPRTLRPIRSLNSRCPLRRRHLLTQRSVQRQTLSLQSDERTGPGGRAPDIVERGERGGAWLTPPEHAYKVLHMFHHNGQYLSAADTG